MDDSHCARCHKGVAPGDVPDAARAQAPGRSSQETIGAETWAGFEQMSRGWGRALHIGTDAQQGGVRRLRKTVCIQPRAWEA